MHGYTETALLAAEELQAEQEALHGAAAEWDQVS